MIKGETIKSAISTDTISSLERLTKRSKRRKRANPLTELLGEGNRFNISILFWSTTNYRLIPRPLLEKKYSDFRRKSNPARQFVRGGVTF